MRSSKLLVRNTDVVTVSFSYVYIASIIARNTNVHGLHFVRQVSCGSASCDDQAKQSIVCFTLLYAHGKNIAVKIATKLRNVGPY